MSFTANCHRVSELEIENEKLHKDILLLRSSIDRGIAQKELEGTVQSIKNSRTFQIIPLFPRISQTNLLPSKKRISVVVTSAFNSVRYWCDEVVVNRPVNCLKMALTIPMTTCCMKVSCSKRLKHRKKSIENWNRN